MSSINNVVLVGRLTRDPELRHTPGGDPVCTFSLAIDRAGDKVDGEVSAGFFDVEAWGNIAENCATYLTKGRLCGVTGALRHHRWEATDGTKRSKVEVRAFQVQFLGSKSENESSAEGQQPVPAAASFGAPSDEDIPF